MTAIVHVGARGAARKKLEGSRPVSLQLSQLSLRLLAVSSLFLHSVTLRVVLLLDSTGGIKEGEEGTLPVPAHLWGSPLELGQFSPHNAAVLLHY